MNETHQIPSPLIALSTQLADAAARAGESIVQVRARRGRSASGTVYAPDSIVMADHSLDDGDQHTVVTPDGRTLTGRVAGRDPASDLAVVRVAGLGVAPIEPTADSPRVGQLVLAVGRSWRGGVSASHGIVSAVAGPLRTGRGAGIEQVVGVDAALFHGFSGGVLVDASQRALGISTAGLRRGVALAIPAPAAWRLAEALAREGGIKRGYLGLRSQAVRLPERQRAGRAQDVGLLVMGIVASSPAEQAGLFVGDILVELDGHAVGEPDELLDLLTAERVGRTLPAVVIRGGGASVLQITVGERRQGR